MNAPRERAGFPLWLENVALLALWSALAAWAALQARQDANWDLQNYHFYDPWAWLSGRIFDRDVAAAQLQTFHSPFADVPFYALVAAHVDPRLITLWLALPTAVVGFFASKIAWRLFADLGSASRVGATIAALAIGFTGAMGRGQLGSTTGEWLVAAPTFFAAFLLLPRPSPHSRASMTALLGAGVLSGIASGLKLTAATYALALMFALLAWPGTLRSCVRAAAIYAAGVILGLALALGPWCAQLWLHFENPLFPYGNEWFRSPWWEAAPLLPGSYGPHDLRGWLEFPFALLAPERVVTRTRPSSPTPSERAVAADISAALLHVCFVIGCGSSCSHAFGANRPSSTAADGASAISIPVRGASASARPRSASGCHAAVAARSGAAVPATTPVRSAAVQVGSNASSTAPGASWLRSWS